MQKKKYTYNYPEQREISKGLRHGDIKFIAEKTGYVIQTISMMCRGERTMPERVRKVVKQLVSVNKQIDNIKAEYAETV